MKIVLAGGGTGGHIYPALSVARALREADPQVELLFIGSSRGPERGLAAEAGIKFESVPSAPLSLTPSVRSIASVGKVAVGVLRARSVLGKFGANACFGTGGYAAAAAVVAQWMRGGKTVIHEQNAVPGRTNRSLARIADVICINFERAARFFPEKKVAVTGMPIRGEFASLPAAAHARRTLRLDEDRFTILVVGGSQGAKRINELMLDAWSLIEDGRTQVLHQVGKRNYEELTQAFEGRARKGEASAGPYYRVEAFVDMPTALAAADIVVGRSGASTLAEVAAAGVPSILIPYPHAQADHQRLNAEEIAGRGAAVVCSEDELTGEVLADLIVGFRSDPDRRRRMSEASRSLARLDAARRIAELLLSLNADAASRVLR